MLASNGKLYGMTWWGGENDEGVIYEFDPITGTYTKKFDFLAGTYGAEPWGGLIELSGGKLYGMTVYGGSNYDGVIFEFDIYTNAFEVKYNFIGDVTGHSPVGTLTLASNGKIYGLTELGGNYGSGVLFEFDPVTNETVSLVHFYGPEKGSYPRGTLLQATNGKLYGMTYQGGYISPEIQENGVFFEFDLDTYTYTKILDFDGSNGKNPYGYIMEASNGNLYAVTKNGGANGKGVMFEYNLQTGVFTKKFDFDGSNGSRPEWNCLIELPNNVGIEDGATDLRINISPNPCKETFTVETTFDYNEDIRIIMQNVLGETVWMLTETVAAGFYTKQINTRDLSEGLYFLSVATSDKLIVKRIIKN
jgi:uncharacterized repeat protein (TIGR03803 family)